MIASLLFALLSVTAAQPRQPFPSGELCVGDATCVATRGAQVRVPPAESARRYVWMSDAHDTIAAGTVAAGATEIDLAGGTSRILRVTPPVRGEVAFALTARDERWQWRVPNPPPSIRLIHPPCSGCVIEARASGRRPFRKALNGTVEIALHPWPRIVGKVIDRTTGAPLPGATITAAGILLVRSGVDGTFDAALEDSWPAVVEVGYPGRATRRVNLSRIAGDDDLGPIALSSGGALHVTVDPPIAQKTTWELRDRSTFALLREGTLDAGASELSIDGIAEGKHVFVVRGSEPLQRFATVVDVSDSEVAEVPIAVRPGSLTLVARRGESALGGRKLNVAGPHDPGAEIVLDGDGKAVEEFWQRGAYRARLAEGSMSFAEETIDTDEFTWRIDIPDRMVTGRVVDAASGAPVADARVTFAVRKGETAVQLSERTDVGGRFRFDAVHDGTHELMVRHEDYLPAENVEVVVAEANGTYPLDIRLHSRNEGRTLAVIDERGAPIADALVILGDRNGIREIAFTGPDGRSVVPLGPEDSGTIFVIPRSGSFAFTRVLPVRGDDAGIALRVRAGTATIDIDARDSAGKPLANVLVLPRVNGLMLPPQLIDSFQQTQRVSFRTDANGHARLSGMPPGVYELWAATGRDQVRAVMSPSPPPPAASLEVIAGRYSVRLGFDSTLSASP